MLCAFAWKAKFYGVEIPNADEARGWERYVAEYVAAFIYSSPAAMGLWLTFGRML